MSEVAKYGVTPLHRRVARRAVAGFLYYLIASFAFIWVVMGYPPNRIDSVAAAVPVSCFLTAGIGLVVYWVGPYSRKIPLIPAVLLRSCCYLACIYLSIVLGAWVANLMVNGLAVAKLSFIAVVKDVRVAEGVLFAFPLLLLFSFLSGISQKLGPGVLGNWVIGRYHHPRQEDRVFMFLDLRGSTTLAETMGDLKFSAFIQDAFRDLTAPLLDHTAEVSHFIGDEVVVSWPLENGVESANCIACYFAIQDQFSRLRQPYLGKYGHCPSFKAGMHAGRVVTTEVGQIKSEIVFHGDVLNTTSRLQGLCNSLDADLLISQTLADLAPAPNGYLYERMGPQELKGKGKPLEVLRVTRSAAKGD